MLLLVLPALCYWSQSLKRPRDQEFGDEALVLSYFRNTCFMKCLLSLWCNLLLARRGFQNVSRLSLGMRYVLFRMGTASQQAVVPA